MALLSDCEKIIGIEALESLHAASLAVLEKYETFVESDEVSHGGCAATGARADRAWMQRLPDFARAR